MGFFDKYAKLVSKVDNHTSDSLVISVYDDELPDSRIMELEAEIYNLEEYLMYEQDEKYQSHLDKFDKLIFVKIVDTYDDVYFKLPQNRQQMAATSLFKRFIKFYNENYPEQLVGADFANYDLQEKFKIACERGIFPKESLDYIQEVSKEQHENSSFSNMNNRETNYYIKKASEEVLKEKGVNLLRMTDQVGVSGLPVSLIVSYTQEIIDKLREENGINIELSELLYCTYNNNDYRITLPLYDSSRYFNISYNIQTKEISMSKNMIDYISDTSDANKFKEIFDEALTVSFYDTNEIVQVQELFSLEINSNSRLKRLVKKSNYIK